MELKFEITEEDYINFNLYHADSSKAHKNSYNLLRYVIPLLCSVLMYAIGTIAFKQPKVYWIIIALLFLLVWIITYPKQYKSLIKRTTKKVLKDGDNSSIFGHKTMVIDEDNIKVISETSTEITSKESVKEVKIYNDIILIYLSGFTAHIVPTRYLTEETKKQLLVELGVS